MHENFLDWSPTQRRLFFPPTATVNLHVYTYSHKHTHIYMYIYLYSIIPSPDQPPPLMSPLMPPLGYSSPRRRLQLHTYTQIKQVYLFQREISAETRRVCVVHIRRSYRERSYYFILLNIILYYLYIQYYTVSKRALLLKL